jgi:hypothetical protein
LEAELRFALSEVEKALDERDRALFEKSVALAARVEAIAERDRVIANTDRALIEKNKALSMMDEAISKREGSVQQLEKRQAQIFRLSKQLSRVPWLRDSSWSVGFNWGLEQHRGFVLDAPPGEESIKTIGFKLVQIPAAALETLGSLGIKKFSDVLDWSHEATCLSPVAEAHPETSSTGESRTGDNIGAEPLSVETHPS